MKLHEECGIFGGISKDKDIAPIISKGLFMLQHRGQESAGICCGDENLITLKGSGLVNEVLTPEQVAFIKGKSGIGHVRYSTQGKSDVIHAQPFTVNYLGENVSIAHNGHVHSAMKLRNHLENAGELFLTSSDTEIILKKVIHELRTPPSQWTFEEISNILKKNFTGGAWSILFGFPGKIMAFRDPLGYRPLVFCEAKEGNFVASEDTAFHLLNKKKTVEIQAGEGIEITSSGYAITRYTALIEPKQCVFEHIYFAKPDSNIFGRNVYSSRIQLGELLANEDLNIRADVVVPIMDSGFPSAVGYSKQSGIPLHMGLLKNTWAGRTFIKPEQQIRTKEVLEKLSVIESVVAGKIIVLVDDSLVRGTTSKEIVKMLKIAGAKEIHLRIASPMIINTCFWGVDIPTTEELMACQFLTVDEICNYIKADSLKYLSFPGLKDVFGNFGWCYHCFEGLSNV